jgi:hypothetical protein
VVERYVAHDNTVRLHSGIGYITPADRLAGRQNQIHEERDRKPAVARERRRERRAEQRREVLAWASSAS